MARLLKLSADRQDDANRIPGTRDVILRRTWHRIASPGQWSNAHGSIGSDAGAEDSKGKWSIALRPGRLRHLISDSSTANVSFGQRWNKAFSAQKPTHRKGALSQIAVLIPYLLRPDPATIS
jgi:hypothetical protein